MGLPEARLSAPSQSYDGQHYFIFNPMQERLRVILAVEPGCRRILATPVRRRTGISCKDSERWILALGKHVPPRCAGAAFAH